MFNLNYKKYIFIYLNFYLFKVNEVIFNKTKIIKKII